MSESVVLCEGFHDRAFWAGWLTHLGCVDPGQGVGGRRVEVYDPWGEKVSKGHFAFHSRGNAFIRVQPCGGRTKLLSAGRIRLGGRNTEALTRLVICIDPDTLADGSQPTTGLRRADLLTELRGFDPAAVEAGATDILLDGGSCCVSLVRWEAADRETPGVPLQQSLERLVCGAICTAYPGRGQAVKAWLDGRPTPPSVSVKEFAWSHMAGWYAEHGCDNFFRFLWEDPAIVSELQARLRSTGAWAVAESLAS